MTTLKLNHNRLSGKIPHFKSTQLVELNVSHNVLDGIDYFSEGHYGNADKEGDGDFLLKIFDASHNLLKGIIPDGIDTLMKLNILDLSFNEVSLFILSFSIHGYKSIWYHYCAVLLKLHFFSNFKIKALWNYTVWNWRAEGIERVAFE